MTDPRHLDGLFDALAALRKVGTPGPCRQAEAAIEALLLDAIERSPVTHEVLAGIVRAGLPSLLSALKATGTGPSDLATGLSGLNRSGHSYEGAGAVSEEFLLAAHADFPGQIFKLGRLAVEATRRDSPALVAALGPAALLPAFETDLVLGEILSGCGPLTAPLIAEMIETRREEIEDVLDTIFFMPEDLKAIAVLLAAGFRVGGGTVPEDETAECLLPLLARSNTAHGRLSLMAEGRDLAGLLARDRHDVFFGLRVEDGEIRPFRGGADEDRFPEDTDEEI